MKKPSSIHLKAQRNSHDVSIKLAQPHVASYICHMAKFARTSSDSEKYKRLLARLEKAQQRASAILKSDGVSSPEFARANAELGRLQVAVMKLLRGK